MDTEVGLIIAWVLQAGALFYWGGQLKQRVDHLDGEVPGLRKDRHQANNLLSEHGFRLSALEDRVDRLEEQDG